MTVDCAQTVVLDGASPRLAPRRSRNLLSSSRGLVLHEGGHRLGEHRLWRGVRLDERLRQRRRIGSLARIEGEGALDDGACGLAHLLVELRVVRAADARVELRDALGARAIPPASASTGSTFLCGA